MAELFHLPDQPIRLTARNIWLHGDDVIGHNVARLFARSIEVQLDGSYALRLGAQRQKIEVLDTAYVVTRVEHIDSGDDGAGMIFVHTSDGQRQPLDPSTLMQSSEHVLYCRVRRGNFEVPCRFSPQQYHDLALWADCDAQGFYLPPGPKRWHLAPYDPRPRAYVGDVLAAKA